jgi:alkyldihydroxyacetonephosphate synthase
MSGVRSHWAWGYEDRLPDQAAREALAEQIGGLLGVAPPRCRPLPLLADVRVAPPRIQLPAGVPGTSALEDRVSHTYGRSYRDLVRGFRGDFASAPDFVAYPEDEAQLASLLAFCTQEHVAAIPFGGGTSVVGGVEGDVRAPFRGVACIDMTRMGRVLEVDMVSRAARIQAGAMGPSLESELAQHGMTLRHFPQSFEFSTLGGWIATRAGGHFATLYTHIDDLVESIRMVTPTGVFESRRLPASGAGPAPDRWVLGSEGIFGVITEAWVRVQPRPRWRASASVRFATFDAGVAAARSIAQSGLHPANCRLLDAREAMLHGVSGAGGDAVLLLGFESADHPLEPWMDRALALASATPGVGPSSEPVYRDAGERGASEDAASWRRAFFEAPYLQSALVTLGVVVDTFETACTWDRFPRLHEAVKVAVEGAMKAACGGGVLTCRFTHVYPDGPAPYYTFLAPGRDDEQLDQWEQIKRAASDALLANGATITHHHAVGRLHRPWYERERPEPFGRALIAAKRAVDPAGVMNPGVLVEGQGPATLAGPSGPR